MSFLNSINISGSALTATRLRLDVIAENMANMSTTRTENGEPYRRKFVVFQERTHDRNFRHCFNRSLRADNERSLRVGNERLLRAGNGVRVIAIGHDMSEFKLDYNPNHPDADEEGFVRMPNVDVVQEMTDMMAAYRAYEANITALNVFKDMAVKTLEIGK